jgi:polyhydroxybutyrate depolymerase
MRVLALCLSLAACSFSTEPQRPAGGAGATDPAGTAARGGADGSGVHSDPVLGAAGGQAGAGGAIASAGAGGGGSAAYTGGGSAGHAGGGQVGDDGEPDAAGGTADGGTAGKDSGTDPALDASEPDSGSPPDDPCPGERLAPGDHLDLNLAHGSGARLFDIHVPQSAHGYAAPVLYVLHPVGFDESWNRAAFVAKSDLEGFIAVFPRAASGVWNYGDCCGLPGGASSVDDVAFLRTLHAEVRGKACVDPGRVYATGMSAGGSLVQRLGCEAADLFTAVATVGSVLGIAADECQPSQPVAVLQIHGTADPQVPYEGSPFTASAEQNAQLWAARNACNPNAFETERDGAASCMTYAPCASPVQVTLCSVEGGGSCWYGDQLCFDGTGSAIALRATDTIWTFLESFSR